MWRIGGSWLLQMMRPQIQKIFWGRLKVPICSTSGTLSFGGTGAGSGPSLDPLKFGIILRLVHKNVIKLKSQAPPETFQKQTPTQNNVLFCRKNYVASPILSWIFCRNIVGLDHQQISKIFDIFCLGETFGPIAIYLSTFGTTSHRLQSGQI